MKLVCFTILANLFVFIHSFKNKDVYRNTLTPTSSRIVGGYPAARRQFPYQASVFWTPSSIEDPIYFICGGTLIHRRFVLTAAHCEHSYGVYGVKLGLLVNDEDNPDSVLIKVMEFIRHHNYLGGVSNGDIALLKLENSVQITPAIQLARLPTRKQKCDEIVFENLSGWGYTSSIPIPSSYLQWANLPRITNIKCKRNLETIFQTSEPLDNTMLCTGSNVGKSQSACSGDSGGPLVNNATGNIIIGVVSWGVSPCGTKDAPTVYTNVCSYLDWIKIRIKNL